MRDLRLWKVVCIVLLTGASGCSGKEGVSLPEDNDVIVLMDRSDPDTEMRIAFSGSNVVFSVAGFPGYQGRSIAVSQDADQAMSNRVVKLIGNGPIKKKAFVPPGPNFGIEVVRNGRIVSELYFDNDDKEFARLAKDIRAKYEVVSTKTYALPEWFRSNAELCRLFGLAAGQQPPPAQKQP